VAARSRKEAGRVEKAMSDKSTRNGGGEDTFCFRIPPERWLCPGESYSGVVPTKQPNKSGRPRAEVVEERPLAKENTEQSNPRRTQSWESGSNGLERVRGSSEG
jgi:hypothetical protein